MLTTSTNGQVIVNPGGVLVTGNSDFSQDASIGGDASIAGQLGVLGDINIGVSDTSVDGAIIFKGGNGGSIRAFSAGAGNDSIAIKTTNGSAYAPLVADSFFPGGQGSYKLDYDGTNLTMNRGVSVTGAITATSTITAAGFNSSGTVTNTNGSYYADTPTTTTQTTSAAIWVVSTGTNYQLRRNSSSARYKTNIIDTDASVLDAAKKIKPRHYDSTIEDESGTTRLGFIAEEVHEAGLTHAVGYDSDGLPESIDATALVAALFARVNDLEERLKTLESK